nr:5'-nucleotidase C-terminal domain-containing protein [uncultured Oscillibacter sp.]
MQTKKLLSLLLALAMMFSLSVAASAAEEDAKPLEGQIVILHTNDVHGAIGSYAKVAALKQSFQDAGAYTLLVDAGDYIQGDPTVSVSQGKTAVELMNLAGYDAATIGNHEFDYGYANFLEISKDAKFPIVSANLQYNGKAENPHTIFTAPGGEKIGVFGLTTPEVGTKAHPAKIKGVTVLGYEKMFDCAQAEVKALEAEGCDYIVCLGHLGIEDESTGNRSIDLLEKVTGIDVFIDAHSHSTIEETAAAAGETVETMEEHGEAVSTATPVIYAEEGKTLVTSTGTKLANVGAVVFSKDVAFARSIPLESITLDGVKEVADRAAAIQKQIDDDYGTVFAKTEVLLNGEKAPGNRTEETNLGDLITDALVWGAAKNGETVDAAVTNGGGIRAPIAAGDITKKDVNTVLPFGNTLSIVKVTGSELLEALEASTFSTPEAVGGFPQVSGIEFTVDTGKEFKAGDLYPGSTYHKPASIERVTIASVGGKDFDEKAEYSIATNDFMAAGGDTYYAFASAKTNYDLGLPMDEVLMDYIKEELGGTVTAAAYGEPAGRITVEAAPAEEPAEEPAPEPAPAPEPEPAPAPEPEPAPAPEPAPEPEPAPAPAPTVAEGDYVVKSGDCLWSIAQEAYGTGRQWNVIYQANKDSIKNPNDLRIGQVLVIPAA